MPTMRKNGIVRLLPCDGIDGESEFRFPQVCGGSPKKSYVTAEERPRPATTAAATLYGRHNSVTLIAGRPKEYFFSGDDISILPSYKCCKLRQTQHAAKGDRGFSS